MEEFNYKYRNNLIDNRLKDEQSDKNSNSSLAKSAKNLATAATPLGALSLVRKINWSKDGIYFLMLMAALLKDVLDVILIALSGGTMTGLSVIPVVGSLAGGVLMAIAYIFIAILSLLTSIFIGLMMILANAREEKKSARVLLRFLILIGGTVFEMTLFGLNFVPVEMVTVIIIYVMVLAERK